MFKAQDGRVLIGFGACTNVVELDLLLPSSLQGLRYDEVKSSPKIGQFFELANMLLITKAAMDAHIKGLDLEGSSKDNPVKVHLPTFDLGHLGLQDEDGKLLLGRLKELFSIVIAYWEGQRRLAVQTGLVAALWRRGMAATDILFQIEVSTGPDGRLIKAAGRGHEILQTVIQTYLTSKGERADAEIQYDEMSDLVERWHSATRSVPINSKEAANSVLHWADYRRLGLVNEAGLPNLEQVRCVAHAVFASEEPATFERLSEQFENARSSRPSVAGPDSAKAAKSLLRQKRKQGKLNRKRGRK